jgi:hypothetical protein
MEQFKTVRLGGRSGRKVILFMEQFKTVRLEGRSGRKVNKLSEQFNFTNPRGNFQSDGKL